MSRTYKYPRESLSDSIERAEENVTLRIKKRIEAQKHQRKKRIKKNDSFRKLISFRDKQRARM